MSAMSRSYVFRLVVLALAGFVLASFSIACGGRSGAPPSPDAGKNAASIAGGETAGETDPYAEQVAEYMRTGVPALIPKWGDKFELPYIGPVLTREGVVERPGTPHPNLVIGGGDSAPQDISRNESVVGLGNPMPATVGTCRHAYLIVNWSGQSQSVNAASAYEKLFDDNAGRTCPSLTDFFDEMSYGKLSITGDVFPSAGAYNISVPANYNDIVNSAMNASNADVDYSQYDGDNDGYIDALTIILPQNIRALVSFGWTGPLFDGKRITTIGFLGEEDLNPESRTAHHEMGHFFRLPDYYDYGGDGAPASPGPDGNESLGDGYWELMCAGNFTNPPMHMSPYNKWLLGWINPTVITSDMFGLVLKPSNLKANVNDAYVLWTDGVFNREFFIIENRWQTANTDNGWPDPGKGLLVWHVDEEEMISPTSGYGVNDIETHKALDLEEADGLDQIDHMTSYGDSGDVYPNGGKNFSFTSDPSSADYAGDDTQVLISNILKDTPSQTVTLDITVTGFTFSLGTLPPLVATGTVDIAPAVNYKVERVELFLDGSQVYESDTTPFAYSWDSTEILKGQVKVGGIGYGVDEQREEEQDLLVDNLGSLYPVADNTENGFYQFLSFDARHPSTTLKSGTRTTASTDAELADPANGQGQWRQSSAWKSSGSYSFYCGGGGGMYGNHESDYLVSRSIDLTGVADPTLSFTNRYDIEATKDFGRVYVTDNDGRTYTQVASYTGTETGNREYISLAGYADNTVRVIFFFESDASGTDNGTTIPGSGWWLDDIVVFDGPVDAIPTVSIVTPSNKQIVSNQMQIQVMTGGDVDEVVYLVYHSGGTIRAKSTTPPYIAQMQTRDFGNQRILLEARAVTSAGLYSSAVVEVDCYNLIGDTNNDRRVDALDLLAIRNNFGVDSTKDEYRPWLDCNGDGVIDERDTAVVGYRFGDWLS